MSNSTDSGCYNFATNALQVLFLFDFFTVSVQSIIGATAKTGARKYAEAVPSDAEIAAVPIAKKFFHLRAQGRRYSLMEKKARERRRVSRGSNGLTNSGLIQRRGFESEMEVWRKDRR
ncbi:hypothetical protein [Rhizobium sp. Root483D2]|uniref:hypothetical protein n=1 Tax=Rhizobium sp. Root483D2 TaxID=1736545 RepID=UPI0012E3D9D2|nr:hypothetical protein [Rhizobium sp. Root483D2]